ncbi:MAG TPA: RnfABCDGE type electron transport complex subunit G [Gammaproteobacteria bacterium]
MHLFDSAQRKRVPYQGALLGATALLASATLGFAYLQTAPLIKQQAAADLTASLKAVIPGIDYDNDLLSDQIVVAGGVGSATTTVYRARRKGEVVAAVYQVSGKGYGGDITAVMGLDNNGHITAVRVVSHKETPGLGDKIEAAKSSWITSFIGKGLDNLDEKGWHVRKDGGQFDQFSGATITPRGLVAAIKGGVDLGAAHHQEIFTPATMQLTKERAK